MGNPDETGERSLCIEVTVSSLYVLAKRNDIKL